MISVVYACNDAYVRQTLISMVSVWRHNPDATIYLIEDGVSQDNIDLIYDTAKLYGKQVQIFALSLVLPELGLAQADRHPSTIYAKLFLGHLIKEDRILYLDSDVVVQGSLEELFRRDMSCEVAAGVLMPYASKVKKRMQVPAGKTYICDGVVLINLDLWRHRLKEQTCVQYILECHGRPPMLSEGTLNHVCCGEIGVLHPKYNLMPSMLMYRLDEIKRLFHSDCYYEDLNDMTEAVQAPVVIHFMNELYQRPWFEPCNHPLREAYRRLEYEIFGMNQAIRMSLSWHTRMTVWLRKHLPFGIFAALYHMKNRI